MAIRFELQPIGRVSPPKKGFPVVVLRKDKWNDYSYTTQFQAFVFMSADEAPIELGDVKIMFLGQKTIDWTFSDELSGFQSLNELPGEFCSLGQALNYYELLSGLEDGLGEEVLRALNDAAYNQNIRARFEKDNCFETSLLRYSSVKEVLDKAGSFFGQTIIRRIKFSAEIKLADDDVGHNLRFDFEPYKGLPHRVNVLVGVNGVGKTQVMSKLAILLSRFFEKKNRKNRKRREIMSFVSSVGEIDPLPSLYNVVAISFNPFDRFERPTIAESDEFSYSYCGLRKVDGTLFDENELSKNIGSLFSAFDEERRELAEEFIEDLIKCESDFDPEQKESYEGLSAGQKICLNIVLHLISKIRMQSLILIDEPETHLHPKLMTTLYMLIIRLLERFDSFSIISTHSPIIVQQVPSRFVQVIRRVDGSPIISPPEIECFGENLTEISRSVFQSYDSDRDYEQIIDRLIEENFFDAEAVEGIFEGRLGMNARIYLNSKLAEEDI